MLGIEWYTATIAASLHYTHTNMHAVYTICFSLFPSDCLILAMFKKVIFEFWWSPPLVCLYGTTDFAVPVAVNVLMTMGLDPTLATLSLFSPLSPTVVLVLLAPSLLAPHYTAVLHQSTHAQPDRSVCTALLSRIIFFFRRSHCYYTVTLLCLYRRME